MDNDIKSQCMSIYNTINYVLLYLVQSTGYKIVIVIKTPYLNLVNMQTDDLGELGSYMMSSEPQ